MIVSYKNKIKNGIQNIFNNLNSPSFDIDLSNKGIFLVLKELKKLSELNLISEMQNTIKIKYKNDLIIENNDKLIFNINNKLYKFDIYKKEVSVADNKNDRFVNLGSYNNLMEELKIKLNKELKFVLPIIFKESIKIILENDKMNIDIEKDNGKDIEINTDNKVKHTKNMLKIFV